MSKMPILFAGHGSPMNAIENNEYSKGWAEIAKRIPKPKAILSISAHWYTKGTRINNSLQPKVIYDMYGFPEELYQVNYNAKGSPEFANLTKELIESNVNVDNSFGIDHGTWAVLCKMYPEVDIPVFQLSVDINASAEEHYRMGTNLKALREKGVLIFASGNVVHNLARVDWSLEGGHPWAVEFDNYIKNKIISKQYQDVIHYENAGSSAKLAFTTPEHFYPLLYILGASDDEDKLSIYNDSCTLGALSMTSYLFE